MRAGFRTAIRRSVARQCTQVSDLNALSETAIMIARPIATVPVEAP